MEMFRRTFAEINLDHLYHNYSTLKSLAGADRFFCPMVKANAYGHGDVQVSQFLQDQGAEVFGVCLIEEGHLLRQSGINSEILVFRGFDKDGAQKILDLQLTPVVSTWSQLESFEFAADEPIKVHVKFNTGMNRLGFNSDQHEKIKWFFKNSKKLKLSAILSHFHSGEDAYNQDGYSAKQTQELSHIADYFSDMDLQLHLLNSAGISNLSRVRQDKIEGHFLENKNWGFRPGLSLYGYDPLESSGQLELKPVMTLKSVVNNIRVVKAGESVSYGAQWVAQRDSLIAVVPIGYADGVHRLLSNRGRALFAEKEVPIIGRICMDFLMLDLTAAIGLDQINKYDEEEVILFGYDQAGHLLSAEVAAKASETVSWEVLTSVGERVPRKFKPHRISNLENGLKGVNS
jgi:alanine racemase